MLVHSVYFWLTDGVTEAERSAFQEGLASLKAIDCAKAVYVGAPAATAERPVVDATYDFALIVILKDMAAHDAYQVSPLHKAFLEAHKDKWKAVRIYDAE